MSYKRISPIPVIEGGTGAITLTNHGTLLGRGTGAIGATVVGSNGQVLLGSTAADPSFVTPAVGASGNLSITTNASALTYDLIASPSVTGSLTAGTSITATAGNITATAGDVVITSGNLKLPNTTNTPTGQIQFNGIRFVHNFGNTNTFIGGNSGNTTLSATSNVGIGTGSLTGLTTAGGFNCAGGVSSLAATTSGATNSAWGFQSGLQLLTGSNNCFFGTNSGTAYTGAESSNILIGSGLTGTLGESNNLRIGLSTGTGAGQLNAAHIAGIYNKAVGATNGVVSIDNANLLGSSNGGAGTLLSGGASGVAFTATPTVTSMTFGAGSALSTYTAPTAWTPVLAFGGLSTGITYTSQSGSYMQIGGLKYLYILIVLSSKGSATGIATVTGSPLSVTSVSPMPIRANALTYTGYLQCFMATSTMNLEAVSAGVTSALTDTAFSNSTILEISGCFV